MFDDFQQELAMNAEIYRNQPEKELHYLFLLALEREQIVSVGYRDSVITDRVNQMPISQTLKELIRHALLWAWKDEEMHTIYIRGLILKKRISLFSLKAFVTQAAGAIGGWSSSVCQHARWSDAPISRFLAVAVTQIGTLSGKVPKNVRPHLEYGPFRNFCLFNVDAEKTAWLCWHHIAELATKVPSLPPETQAEFLRIKDDEENHERVFQILADALDEKDQLAPGQTEEEIARKLGEISEFFLPRPLRVTTTVNNPLGSGGPVYVVEADQKTNKIAYFRQLLEESNLLQELEARASLLKKPLKDFRIAIKTTFMLGYHQKDYSPLVDSKLIPELARFLREKGCVDIAVLESPNIYDQFFKNRSVFEVAQYFSITSPEYRLVDISEDQVSHDYIRGLAQSKISKTWKEADFRISFGKMRSHPVELALLTIGNMEGIGNRCDNFLFVERQAHRETALMMLLSDSAPHFALLDAFDHVPDGLLGVMGSPKPKQIRRFYAGRDALSVDRIAGSHIGIKHVESSSLLKTAIQWFGDCPEIEVIGINAPIKGWRSPYYNEFSAFLSLLAYPVYSLASGRGRLFVPEMDERAFPMIEPETRSVYILRRLIRAFLGLRHRKRFPS